MARAIPKKRLTKKDIKAKADRAEKKSKGEEVKAEASPLEPEVTKKKHGRPTEYTPEIGDRICAALATGMSLRSVCRADDIPPESTVRGWTHDVKHPFSAQYVRAREIGYLSMADETIEISDDGSNDWMEKFGKDGEAVGWTINGEHIQRSRLRVDTRKWLLSKCLPKVFGDKVVNEITGKDGGPIETKDVSDLEVARQVAFLLGKAVAKKADSGTAAG
jgi:hypothetical protein